MPNGSLVRRAVIPERLVCRAAANDGFEPKAGAHSCVSRPPALAPGLSLTEECPQIPALVKPGSRVGVGRQLLVFNPPDNRIPVDA